jgi:hypothetical protein
VGGQLDDEPDGDTLAFAPQRSTGVVLVNIAGVKFVSRIWHNKSTSVVYLHPLAYSGDV